MRKTWIDFIKTGSLLDGMTRDAIEERASRMGFTKRSPTEDTRYFYNKIVPGIASGNHLTGSGSERIVPDFWRDALIYSRPGKKNDVGQYLSARQRDRTNGADIALANGDESVLVHEMKHMQHDDSPIGFRVGEYDKSVLGKAYPFDRSYWKEIKDLNYAERRAVNAQHQFRVMMDMKKRLGRYPTANEFVEYVKNMPDDQLREYILNPVGPYDESYVYPSKRRSMDGKVYIGEPVNIGRDMIDNYRRALWSIAKSTMRNANTWGRFAPRANGWRQFSMPTQTAVA